MDQRKVKIELDIEPIKETECYACPNCYKPMYQYINYRRIDSKWVCRYCKVESDGPVIKPKDMNYANRSKRIITDSDVWSRQEILNELREKSQNPYMSKRLIKYCAVIAFLFVTGARISEVVGIKSATDKNKYIVPPIRKNQIEKVMMFNKRVFRISKMPVLKRKFKIGQNLAGDNVVNFPLRNVALLYDDDQEFIQYIENWLSYIPKDTDVVFKFTPAAGWKIAKWFNNSYCHFFRHARLTDLATTYAFNPIQLQHFVGWADSKMASKYTHLDETVIVKAMMTGNTFKMKPEDLPIPTKKDEWNPDNIPVDTGREIDQHEEYGTD